MKNAFVYMFKTDSIKKNLFKLWLLLFFAELLLNSTGIFNPLVLQGKFNLMYYPILLTGLAFSLIPCGYGMTSLKEYLKDNFELVSIDIIKNFVTGFKFALSYLLYAVILFGILTVFAKLNLFFINKELSPISFIIVALSFLILITSAFIFIAQVCKFAKTENIFSFLNIPSIFKIINNNINKYFVGFILFVILMVIFSSVKAMLLPFFVAKAVKIKFSKIDLPLINNLKS